MTNPLVALGPDSTDRLTAEAPKPPAKEGGGIRAVKSPQVAIAATDRAIGAINVDDRDDIRTAVLAERSAWIDYAAELARAAMRELVP